MTSSSRGSDKETGHEQNGNLGEGDLGDFYENLDRSQWEEKGKICLKMNQRGTWVFDFCDTLHRPLCQIPYVVSSKRGNTWHHFE